MPFPFENLDVYRVALSFSKQVLKLTKENKPDSSWRDQFNRAAMSIALNIAEGAGRWQPRDKANFYTIARGSAFECVPLVDLGSDSTYLSPTQREMLRSELQAICQMLTKLIQRTKEAA